jgi:pyridinium-3,5-bisthiocarboxylic acid mononucleotide nickel chelatase
VDLTVRSGSLPDQEDKVTTIYFDCFSGISGDMILGSLLDLGLSFADLKAELAKLDLKNFSVSAKKIVKAGVSATKFDVEIGHEHGHRNLATIEKIIQDSKLTPETKGPAVKIFRRLAEAEARVHGTSVDKVHFHEVGAIDAIVDIVGACIGFEMLGVRQIHCSALNVGSGFVDCAHGTMPVPAPATAELLRDLPIYSNQVTGELVTPTGAAIVSTLAQGFGGIPPLKIRRIGYGAGTKDFKGTANVVRAIQGDSLEVRASTNGSSSDTQVVVIEANIDDMNPQIYGYLQEKLMALGALDVFASPVQMKKNRPGLMLTVVAPIDLRETLTRRIFEETTTIGVRFYPTQRRVLERDIVIVESEFGKVGVKVSRLNGKIINFSPEYEDCRQAATKHTVPFKWVQSRVIQQFLNQHSEEAGLRHWSETSLPQRRNQQ